MSLSLILFSSALQTVIFPVAGPLPVWRANLAWVALVPWLIVLLRAEPARGASRIRDLVGASYLCGFLWYLGTCYWVFATMHDYGKLSAPMALLVMLLFCLYLGLYHALFGLFVALLARRTRLGRAGALWAVPFAWVAVELARARITSFPWNPLGVAAIDNSVLTRLAPWTGAYGLSFAIAAINTLFAAFFVLRNRRWAAGPAFAAAALASALAWFGMHMAQPVRIGQAAATLLQPNLLVGAQRERLEEDSLLEISERLSAHPRPASARPGPPTSAIAAAGAPHRSMIVLWPESPSPYATVQPEFLQSLSEFSRTEGVPLIVGATGIELDAKSMPPFREYNSAVLFTPERGYAGRYDKIHLVPFGEFVPYAGLFSFAGGLTREVGSVERGQSRAPMQTGGHRYGVFLCYESIFGDEIRQFAANGAEVLVNLSDDGWYGDTSAPFQHINMARMRAIENRRWLLRDTNSGVTASIDPYGRVVESTARHVRTAVQVHFDFERQVTFYTRHGDLFAYACSLVTGALLLLSFERKRVN